MEPTQVNHLVYIALGSNLGDRSVNLKAAHTALEGPLHILEASPVYVTPPWGYEDQPEFFNQVIKASTKLSPEELLHQLKKIETTLGRIPSIRYGPRLIDLDILFYDDLIYTSDNLQIPHPRLGERAFVLVPLADLSLEFRHPKTGLTVSQMLAAVDVCNIYPYSKDQPPREPTAA